MLSWRFYFSRTGSLSQSILPLFTNSQSCSAWQLTAHSLDLQSSQATLKVCRLMGAWDVVPGLFRLCVCPSAEGALQLCFSCILLVRPLREMQVSKSYVCSLTRDVVQLCMCFGWIYFVSLFYNSNKGRGLHSQLSLCCLTQIKRMEIS